MHKRIPSFTISKAEPVAGQPTEAAAPRSRSRGRSLSPWRRSSKRDDSEEGVRRESGDESDLEGGVPVNVNNAFESDSEDESEPDEDDAELERNTEANAIGAKEPSAYLSREMRFPGEGPNLVPPSDLPPMFAAPRPLRRKPTKSKVGGPTNAPLPLVVGRPIFARNRCTVTLIQGDPTGVAEAAGRKPRKYLVASDLSEESLYAIQWAIGTVLRDGDECLIVSVMETDAKFDVEDASATTADKKAKIVNQKERQSNALMLSRQATALLERTRLNVKVECQAIHAKHARHMLIDMIDYLEPTMAIIGTRGLSKIKGMLLGSVSNYLIQKSSCPVMVTRRPLRLARTVHKRLSSLNRESRMPLAQAAIEKGSHGGAILADDPEPDTITNQIDSMTISTK